MINKRIVYGLMFLCIIASHAQAAFLLDRVVAVVNQEVITWSELYRSMETDASPALKALPEEERKKIFKENETMFLETLISFRLQIQEAANNRITVSEAEVNETIDGIQKKYSMTDAEFQNNLKAEGYTLAEYRRRLGEQLLQSKIVNQQVRGKVVITDADVDKFMKENREFAGSSESYRIRQIFFKKPDDEAEKSRVEEKAQAVFARALQGDNFAELALLHSEDATREDGGDLGFIEKRNLAKEFGAALATMKKGDISRPFWSDRGMHIIKLEEMSGPRSSAEIREEAKAEIQSQLFNERYKDWIRSLRENSFIDIRL